MYVADVASYFRLLVQEPDTSFIADAQVTTLLRLGYREFREKVTDIDERHYITTVTITPNGSSYDLASVANAVVILGDDANLTDARMMRLVQIATADNDIDTDIWRGVSTRRALLGGTAQTDENRYMLEGTTLYFETVLSGTPSLRLYYIPEESVDWTALSAPPNTFIDDLSGHHELIALYAARRYQIFGATVDPEALEREIARGEAKLLDYLSAHRDADDRYIQRDELYTEGW
jgi:hypothetical protein